MYSRLKQSGDDTRFAHSKRFESASLAFVLVLVLVSTGFGQEGQVPAMNVEISEELKIGTEGEVPPEALLGSPQSVRTDGEGRIYVGDRDPSGVKLFDSTGAYVRTIGSAGRGPGEFQMVDAMHVNERGRLMVADWRQQRLITFSPEGGELENHQFDGEQMGWPRYLDQLPGGEFVFLAKRTGPREQWGDIPLIYLFGPEMQFKTAFGSTRDLWETEHEYAHLVSAFDPGSAATCSNGDLIFAPQLYQGTLYRISSPGTADRSREKLTGHVRTAEAFVPLEDGAEGRYVNSAFSRGEEFTARIRNTSEAVFCDARNRVIHFTFTAKGEQRVFGVELFGQDGELEGYAPISRYVHEGQGIRRVPPTFHWMDDRGRFYLVDRFPYPVVRVLDIRFDTAE